jgi:hypothetical protein
LTVIQRVSRFFRLGDDPDREAARTENIESGAQSHSLAPPESTTLPDELG